VLDNQNNYLQDRHIIYHGLQIEIGYNKHFLAMFHVFLITGSFKIKKLKNQKTRKKG
jgi:hypothetical protein